MRKIINEKNLTRIFQALAIALFTLLFVTSLFITGTHEGIETEYIIIENNWPVRIIAIIVLFITAMTAVGKLYDKVFSKWNRNILLGVVCAAAFLFSIYWVASSGTMPQADQNILCAYANAFNQGDFQGIWKGRYIARYMQQLGLVTFLRGLFLLFGEGNYMAFQYFSACTVPLIILSGCKILRRLSGNNGKAEFYYLILAGTCFPMYAYTAFVYGDLSSTAIILLCAWAFLACLEKFTVPRLLAVMFTAGFAVQLRKNVLIVLLAFEIVILVKLIQKWNWKVLAVGCSIVLGLFLSQAALRGIYHDVWDSEAHEIPAVLYIAMGLHNTNNHPGWHDNYEYIIFAESHDDVEASVKIGIESIKEYLQQFKENPDYMRWFYKTKIDSQWQAPMYQCIVMNNLVVREQSRIVQMIYQEELLGKLIKNYMKGFQLFMYGCILLWLLTHWKKTVSVEKYFLLIAVFGGFLFSIIWEAKTRYVFPYMLLMIPYFAMGMQELIQYCELGGRYGISFLRKIKRKTGA